MTRATHSTPSDLAMTLHDQICARFRALITDGGMAPGSRAPSLRSLAVELGVARGTVVAAYDRLIGEGYLSARGTAGTFVAARPPETRAAPPGPTSRQAAVPDAEPLSGDGTTPLPLQLGLPALDAFPRKVWARLISHHARKMDSLMKPHPFGLPRLREALAVYLHRSRGVEAQARQVFVVPGYEAGLALASSALLAREDAAVVEDPGYPPTAHVLRRQGLVPVPVPVDDAGLDVEALKATANGARLAVVTPSHQSPLGVALSLQRRRALLDWATAAGAWIFEDDYDGEYRYHGPPLPALKSLDRQERVVYGGTLSKVLYPGLRLAYLVVPPSLVDGFERAARDALSGGCPTLMQEVVADFIEQGHFARHIKRMRALYAHRRGWLLDALKPYAAHGLSCANPQGGMHLTIMLPPDSDDVRLAQAARRAGVAVHALSDWRRRQDGPPGLLASFTNVESPDAAVEAVARLAAALGLRPRPATRTMPPMPSASAKVRERP
ncbi:PLP-dependent aminotransferase family protein [Roseateles chitinivorans]|uniref:MocR-like pyridoxine biosynthesis transcription factor PdxR n=1 Tax=Roseateles chitinivorans TaxID=2917965 RepID=UPI003D66E060